MVAEASGESLKERDFITLAPFSPAIDVGVHNNNFRNARRAIMERVFKTEGADGTLHEPPVPGGGVFKRALESFRLKLARVLPSTNRVSTEDFLSMVPARKRKVYQAAAESLASLPIRKKDSFLSTFIKMEKILFSSKPDPAPRVIQPRNPRYNIEVGRFLKPLEHQIYQAVAGVFGGPTIMKGYNSAEQGRIIAEKWHSFRRPVAIGLDASRFDQHVSVDALKWEHGVYTSCFHDRDEKRELKRLLKWQLHNRGFCRVPDGTIKYKTDGCRMSGDMNTALGNCLLMCGMIYSLMDNLGISHYELVNNGDDCTLIMEEHDEAAVRAAIPGWFLALGFTMKVGDTARELEQIEFCQTHPVEVSPGEWILVRNCPVALAKDSVCLLPLTSQAELMYWLDAVGQGGLSLTGGVPIYQEFYAKYIQLGAPNDKILRSNQMEGGFWMLAKGMTRDYRPITDTCRLSFYKAFGILPDEQIAREHYYRDLNIDLQLETSMGSSFLFPNYESQIR